MMEAGRELVSRLDGQNQSQSRTQCHVQEDLDTLRKSWEDTQRLLGVRKALAESVILVKQPQKCSMHCTQTQSRIDSVLFKTTLIVC